MDPRQEVGLNEVIDAEFGNSGSESDSGYQPNLLSLEDMCSLSEHGGSYSQGSDLPRSPVFSDPWDDNYVDIPVIYEISSGDEAEEVPVYDVSSEADIEEFPEMPAGPDHVGKLHGIPAGAKSDSEEDEFGLSHAIPAGSAGCIEFPWVPVHSPLGTEDDAMAVPGPSCRPDSFPEFLAPTGVDSEDEFERGVWTPPPQLFGAEDDSEALPGPSCRPDFVDFSRELPIAAEADSTGDGLASGYSPYNAWYERSVYWESWYEDLMHDLGEF